MTEADDIERIREEKLAELSDEARADGSDPDTEGETPAEPVHVEGAGNLADLVETHEVVLVDFHADWCGPCKMLEPIVADVAAESPAAVAKVDVDANQGLAGEYGVRGVPTLMLFADGDPVERIVGIREKTHLLNLVDQHAGS